MPWAKSNNFAYNANLRAHRVVGLGDSITAGLDEWDEQLNAMCRAKVIDKGVDGNRLSTANNAASVESRFQTDVVDIGATWCICAAGTNDIRNDATPLANMQATVPALNTAAIAAGIRIDFCNVAPSSLIDGRETDRTDYNTWLAAWGVTNGVVIYDIDLALRNPSAVNELVGSYTTDNLHLTSEGAGVMAALIYAQSQSALNQNR
jgi:lysophospholipase L1-like esterase